MRIRVATAIVIIGLMMAVTPQYIPAIDAPHNASNNISCGDCHGETVILNSPFWGGSVDGYDQICTYKCHTAPFGPYTDRSAPRVQTHSYLTADPDPLHPKYGNWIEQCRNCHDPHYQRQKNYKTSDASNLYLATGTITSSPPPSYNSTDNKTTLYYSYITYKQPEWNITKLTNKTGDNRRTILFPNVNKLGYSYPIIAVDATTITVTGDATVYLYPPTTFAAIYGQYIKDNILTDEVNGTYSAVKFFDQIGQGSFAYNENMPGVDLTRNGVCQVCHNNTTHWKSDGTGADHYNNNVYEGGCIYCHPHTEGFKPNCNACHGYPPGFNSGSLVFIDKDGNPVTSDSSGVGAHAKHYTVGFVCFNCHTGGMLQGAAQGDNLINIGFNLNSANLGGTYDGKTGRTVFPYVAGGSTTVTANGSLECSNLYCHSQGTSNTSPYAAPNIPATWGGVLDATCTGCHSGDKNATNKMNTGSHTKHIVDSSIDCTKCHNQTVSDSRTISNQSNHVNNLVNVAYDTASNPGGNATYNGSTSPMTKTPGTAYGSCSNVSCHGSSTPIWGGASIACDGCHKASNILQGKHETHYGTGVVATSRLAVNNSSGTTYIYNCGVCHDPGATTHGGGVVSGIQAAQVAFDATVAGGGTYAASGTLAGTDNGFNWTAGAANNACSNTYCHSPGTTTIAPYPAPNVTSFQWTGSTLTCSGCHGNPPAYANGSPKANSHSAHSAYTCNTCHVNTTSSGTTISEKANHVNKTYNVDAGAGASFTYTSNSAGGTCSNISCHCNTTNAQWGGTSACLNCHSQSCGNRAAITTQFSANSHHIQGATLTSAHCYQCHWEANSDGTINHTYHGGPGAPDSPVDLVIYLITGELTQRRPTTYTLDVTAKQYTANDAVNRRVQLAKINDHCLGCHRTENDAVTPFGDGKTPNAYAWDNESIKIKYSNTGTTTWGKYTTVTNAAQKNITKAYSAHGNAAANKEGWDTTNGVDGTITDTTGSTNVACFDCHNSHGSSAGDASHPTTSYTSVTTNGGILKDTTAGKGGYSMTYHPVVGGSSVDKDAYNPGAGLCFDCHLTAASGTTPWGYNSTFGATQAIIGYWDTPYFGPGTFGSQQRFPFKSTPHKGGHFGASSSLSGSPTGTIGGICTPCHDPHGVTDNTAKIAAADKPYAVPLLKGTFMTSPYKEDTAPASTSVSFSGGGCTYSGYECWGSGFGGASYPSYNIDQNTFATWDWNSTTRINENVSKFGGLCLNCHPQSVLNPNAGSSNYPWRSMNRIHNTVKGWGGQGLNANNAKHSYTCSKCHTVHNSRLPRLMVTNCLDYSHRGNVVSGGQAGSGSGGANGYYGGGGGSGKYPAGGSGSNGSRSGFGSGVACHDATNSDPWPDNQQWNTKTNWAATTVISTSPNIRARGTAQVTVTITGTGFQAGATVSFNDANITLGAVTVVNATTITVPVTVGASATIGAHNVTVTNTDGGTGTGNGVFIVGPHVTSTSPNSLPQGSPQTTVTITGTGFQAGATVSFNDANITLGAVTVVNATTITLPVTVGASATNGAHNVTVTNTDGGTGIGIGVFVVGSPPPAPTLIANGGGYTDYCGGPVQITLSWNAVTCPDGHTPEYYVEVSTDSTFATVNYNSGWLPWTSTSWTTPALGVATWYWRVTARDSVDTAWVSQPSSPIGSFTVSDGYDYCSCYGCPSSCPFVYVWNGSSYNYLTDLAGEVLARGARSKEKVVEFTELFGPNFFVLNGLVRDSDNNYKVKVRETIAEADYFDQAKLLLVDHPAGYEVFVSTPAETYVYGYSTPFQVYAVKDARPPVTATDKNGGDVTHSLTAVDGETAPVDLAGEDNYTLDFGNIGHPEYAKLLIDGWTVIDQSVTYPATGGSPSYVEVIDENGNWIVVKTAGRPEGDFKTMVVDLSGLFKSGDHRIRFHAGTRRRSKMIIDRIRLSNSAPVPVNIREVVASSADLHHRGADRVRYASLRVRTTADDATLPDQINSYLYGAFTAYGDVKPLLSDSDDMYAIIRHGDELTMIFPDGAAPPDDWERSTILKADVFYKGLAAGTSIDPLPFHGISIYPYDPTVEHYPDDAEHNQYRTDYNTRTYP